jgi:hypothetical protein
MTGFLILFVVLLMVFVGLFLYPAVLEVRELARDIRKVKEQAELAARSAEEWAPYLRSVRQRADRLIGPATNLPEEARQLVRETKAVVSNLQGIGKTWRTTLSATGPETAARLHHAQASMMEAAWNRPIRFLRTRLRRTRREDITSRDIARVEKPLSRRPYRARHWLIPAVVLAGGVIGTVLVKQFRSKQEPDTFGDTY